MFPGGRERVHWKQMGYGLRYRTLDIGHIRLEDLQDIS